MKHECLTLRLNVYRANISKKSDKVVLYNLMDVCDDGTKGWFNGRSPGHRAYMRLIQVEARKRGLDHASVTGLR